MMKIIKLVIVVPPPPPKKGGGSASRGGGTPVYWWLPVDECDMECEGGDEDHKVGDCGSTTTPQKRGWLRLQRRWNTRLLVATSRRVRCIMECEGGDEDHKDDDNDGDDEPG